MMRDLFRHMKEQPGVYLNQLYGCFLFTMMVVCGGGAVVSLVIITFASFTKMSCRG